MRKSRILMMALALSLGVSIKAYAQLPSQSIIIGDRGYSIGYIMNHAKDVNDLLNSSISSSIYYTGNGSGGNYIQSVFNSTYINEVTLFGGVLPNITFYDDYGTKTQYIFKNGAYTTIDLKEPWFNLKLTNTGVGLNILNVQTNDLSATLPDAVYFKLDDSDTVARILPIVQGYKTTDYQVTITVPATKRYEGVSILREDKTVLATGLLDLSNPNADVTLNQVDQTEDQRGNNNALGNINNNGLVAKSGDAADHWIYYSNIADGGKLYKKNLDGSDDFKLSEDNAKYLNVADGWIYYSNYSDGGKIYKVRTDGTKRRKVTDERASYLNVVGGYIYYVRNKQGPDGNMGNICKIRIDDPSTITGTKVTSDEAQYINVSGDTIFFTNKTQGGKLYSVHTDGTFMTRISDTATRYVTVVEGFVYYCTDEGEIYKYYTKGLNYQPVKVPVEITLTTANGAAIKTEDKVYGMNITGSNIYYWSNKDGNRLYKLAGLNGGTAVKWSDEPADSVNVVNADGIERVYITNGTKMFEVMQPNDGFDSKNNPVTTYVKNAIVKPKLSLKIVSSDSVVYPVKDITGGVTGSIYDYMPDKVTAVMSDNSVQQLLVNWDYTTAASKGGVTSYKGIIVGYGKAVTLSMTMFSEPLIGGILTNNSGDQDDIVTVANNNLVDGDVIKVYKDSDKKVLLGTGTVVGGKASIYLKKPNNVDDKTDKVYITRTSKGKTESVPSAATGNAVQPSTVVAQSDVIIVNNALGGDPDTVTVKNLAAGDFIKIYNSANMDTLLGSGYAISDGAPFGAKYQTIIQLTGNYALGDGAGTIYVTKTSANKAEGSPVAVTYGDGVARQLVVTVIDQPGASSNSKVLINLPQHLTGGDPTLYEYYYKIDNVTVQTPTYGQTITAGAGGWQLVPGSGIVSGVVDGDKIYVAETYNHQVLRAGNATAHVLNETSQGNFTVAPANAAVSSANNIILDYKPLDTIMDAGIGNIIKSYNNGTVEFDIPANSGITVSPGTDTITYNGTTSTIAALSATGAVSYTSSNVIVYNVTGNGDVVLTLKNKVIPTVGNYDFTAVGDLDGNGPISSSTTSIITFTSTYNTANFNAAGPIIVKNMDGSGSGGTDSTVADIITLTADGPSGAWASSGLQDGDSIIITAPNGETLTYQLQIGDMNKLTGATDVSINVTSTARGVIYTNGLATSNAGNFDSAITDGGAVTVTFQKLNSNMSPSAGFAVNMVAGD